ncbi:sensor histidine kinase [Candidatus Xianfuyuplasma coldseepsis]|uniref:histidine kinase n=1 Tax=Candidatus Xianfuyuplasma coldseepsis TaxID=2782163 RepID=A0A7L7KSK3_9MOLU|nr:HAMP domain-containing sensor histidine kinase [Xianfuyuplasma coldseepsis]QMS85242.1 HAMP domain-containing histidine kinase [Xianfuyuplasma coldseepsis]
MNSLYKLSRKRVLILIGSFLFLVLFGVSSVAYLVNQYYREQLVEIENERFVEFFEHDFKFSGEESAIDLAKHYAHVNNLQLIITDDSDSIIYETEKPVEEFSIYSIEVNESLYSIKIDYSNSRILLVRDKEIMIMYYIIISVYTITIVYIVISRRLKNKRILSDLGQIEYLISNKQRMKNSFHYEELARLFDTFNEFSSKLDLLQEKRKDGFNALAHDLKTPITILLNHLEGITETDELFKNKEAILESLRNLSSTASDLVSENFQGISTRFNISKALKKELPKYTSSFASRNMKIKDYILDDLYVEWNRTDFSRVLGNLLTNAFYYSDKDTEVTVQLINGSETYSLVVINYGELINDENLERIFEKNVRISEEGDDTGNGIGLYITKLLVQEAGGTIKATSSQEFNRFEITLPKWIED